MNTELYTLKKTRGILRGLSIRQRLPLQICILLLFIIIGFSFASYYTVRKAALETGRERLRLVTNQLSGILSQSTGTLVTSIQSAATNDTARRFLASGGKELKADALEALKKLRTDSTTALVLLMDTVFLPLLDYAAGNETLGNQLSAISTHQNLAPVPDRGIVGKIYTVNNSMYFAVTAPVKDKNQTIGYLVSWKLLSTSPQTIEQLSLLMGKGALLYIGNTDGSLWTDMVRPVLNPPVELKEPDKYFEYSNSKGDEVIAAVQLISNSNWKVLIEFSKQTMLEGAFRVLKWIIIIGLLLIGVGIFLARLMSNKITKPLKQLTEAATAISKGDYSLRVKTEEQDELGKLAGAFNIMAEQVENTHVDLESKVQDRTAQLESVNRELEAFSYSISHDLRAPLRGIIGFTAILEENYTNQLGDEAMRITSVIKANTLKMANLIDDLLSFSRLGRNDIVKKEINTGEMVKEIIEGLDPKYKEGSLQWVIGPLATMAGDANTIRQVWTNLISNAIKYSAQNEHPAIEIGSFRHEGQAAFFVKDNGVGFDEKYKHRLFKVFQRLHTASEFEGTGIGLAIVEKIITKHGGHVWVEAAIGKGACFYFSVPG